MSQALGFVRDSVRERLELEQTRIRLLSLQTPHVLLGQQRRLYGAVTDPEWKRKRVQTPVKVDQRADLREEADAIIRQRLQREGRLAPSRRQQHEHAAFPTREPQPEDARQALRVEMVGRAREQEVVRRAAHGVRMLALNGGPPGFEDGDGAAEVVHDRAAAGPVHDVLLGDVVGGNRSEGVEVRCPPLDRHFDVHGLSVAALLEPCEVLPQGVHYFGPISAHPEA